MMMTFRFPLILMLLNLKLELELTITIPQDLEQLYHSNMMMNFSLIKGFTLE